MTREVVDSQVKKYANGFFEMNVINIQYFYFLREYLGIYSLVFLDRRVEKIKLHIILDSAQNTKSKKSICKSFLN